MKHKVKQNEARNAVGIFFATEPLEQAVDELREVGLDPEDIGLVAENTGSKKKLSRIEQRVNGQLDRELMEELDALRKGTVPDTVHAALGGLSVAGFALLGASVVAIAGIFGSATTVMVAAIAVVAGVIGLTALVMRKTDAQRLNAQVDQGHLLLFARVYNDEEERRVLAVLRRFSGARAKLIYPAVNR